MYRDSLGILFNEDAGGYLHTGALQGAKHFALWANVDRSSGSCTVPDPALTLGEMYESLACVSNTGRPRHGTRAEKKAILAAYEWPAGTDKSMGEFDHWLPQWMGGTDTEKNIWFEPHAGKFGSLLKDKVELLLYRKVCVDKTMKLAQANKLYLKGWTQLVPKQ